MIYKPLFNFFRFALLFLFALEFIGCASLPGARVESFHGKKFEYVFNSGKSPAVIFENGLGGKLDWWAKIYPAISKSQTAFAYNRPGYGDSDATTTSRDAATVVDELRQLLRDLKIVPPYILVGHSLGGLYFQYYARRYPDEVHGLILVDSTHPEQMSEDGAFNRMPWWIRTLFYTLTPKAGLAEFAQIEKTGQEVLAQPKLNTEKIQTVIMLASEPENPSSPLEKHIVKMKADFHRLYPDASFMTIKGNHSIPLHSPEVVVEQIKKMSLNFNH